MIRLLCITFTILLMGVSPCFAEQEIVAETSPVMTEAEERQLEAEGFTEVFIELTPEQEREENELEAAWVPQTIVEENEPDTGKNVYLSDVQGQRHLLAHGIQSKTARACKRVHTHSRQAKSKVCKRKHGKMAKGRSTKGSRWLTHKSR